MRRDIIESTYGKTEAARLRLNIANLTSSGFLGDAKMNDDTTPRWRCSSTVDANCRSRC